MIRNDAVMSGSVFARRRTTAPRQSRARGLARFGRRLLGWMVLVLVMAVWTIYLRPDSLSGPAAYVGVSGQSMLPMLQPGDLVLTQRAGSYGVGDVVVYRVPGDSVAAGQLVIHRIIGTDGSGSFILRGDNTNGPDAWHPASSDIVGRLWFYVPGAARLISWLRQPQVIASLAAAFAVVLILMWLPTARATESAAAR